MAALPQKPLVYNPDGPGIEEVGRATLEAARIVVWKRYHGCPPRGMSWEDLYQEVACRTLRTVAKWCPVGAKKTLKEVAYIKACNAMLDFLRERNAKCRREDVFIAPIRISAGDDTMKALHRRAGEVDFGEVDERLDAQIAAA